MTMTECANPLDSASNSLAGVIILAGGASKRMGTPKAKLMLSTGEPLLDYHVRHALKLNVPIMIADNARGFTIDSTLIDNELPSPVIHIADYDPSDIKANQSNEHSKTGGALVAIESALQALTKMSDSGTLKNSQSSPLSWLLVISCDSLIPAMDLWQKLESFIGQDADKKVICLADEHHLYPLLGIYQLSIKPNLKAYIDSGERRVMAFIKPMAHSVKFSKQWQHLTNFNTPTEFAFACTALNDL
ncbi:molybdenum cofactor guanylyltransferase [Psychrobacter sp. B38]|uniref:molybdenum cofactor guanylyltransferase n=1 Tax=Psychrobacter sp. B38 TaxID=3143538 RepID=UPI00320D2D2B